MADTINTTEATHEAKKPNAFVNFFKNNLVDKRYDSLGLIGAGVLCCVLSGAMGYTTRKNNQREILETLSNRAGYQMRQNVISSEIFKNGNLNMQAKEEEVREKLQEERENEYLRNQKCPRWSNQ